MLHLCLDLGGTGSRAALFDAGGTSLARVEGPAGAVSLGIDRTLAAIAVLRDGLSVRSAPQDTTLCIGLAGIGLRDRVAALADALRSFRTVTIVGDGYGALLAATRGQPGALIAVGTGVAAMRLMLDGSCRTASGWGFPGGDLGSGAWIGLRTIAALTRRIDAPEAAGAMPAELARNVMEITGSTAPAIMDWQTQGRAGDFARVAPVIAMAAKAGDSFATRLMQAAAGELAKVAGALWDGAQGPVFLTGGLGPALQPYCLALAPDCGWTLARADPLAGLSLLARGLAPSERLVARPGLDAPDYS